MDLEEKSNPTDPKCAGGDDFTDCGCEPQWDDYTGSWKKDLPWNLAAGYSVKCVRCQQLVLISDRMKGSLVCESCEPNDDGELLDDRYDDFEDD